MSLRRDKYERIALEECRHIRSRMTCPWDILRKLEHRPPLLSSHSSHCSEVASVPSPFLLWKMAPFSPLWITYQSRHGSGFLRPASVGQEWWDRSSFAMLSCHPGAAAGLSFFETCKQDQLPWRRLGTTMDTLFLSSCFICELPPRYSTGVLLRSLVSLNSGLYSVDRVYFVTIFCFCLFVF